MSAISSIASTPAMTVMIAAVRKAARGVQRDYGEIAQLQVSKKGPGNYVSRSRLRKNPARGAAARQTRLQHSG
jgi:hypothetical protein